MFHIFLSLVVDAFAGVGEDVEGLGEFAVGVEFEFLHCLEIEFESFEGYYQDLG